MKQFLITAAGVFAGLMIFLIGLPLVLVLTAVSAAGPGPVPARAVLELDLREPITDQSPHGPLASFSHPGNSVMGIVEALHAAEGDDRVKSLLIRLPESGMEPGAADEIRQALRRFHAAGKTVVAHSQGLYPSGIVTATYMLGAAADEFWMQPGASLQVTGISHDDVFFKRFFDKYGVKPEYQQRYQYKNAVNGYLYDDYTPAHREAELSWMGSVYDSELAAAAADRRLQPAVLRKSLEAGPYLAEDAQRLRLIDRLGDPREAEVSLLRRAGDGAKAIGLDEYGRAQRSHDRGSGPSVAIIEAEGAILTGKDSGRSNPFAGGSNIYSDDLAGAFYKAAKAKDVKAIVFRLDSPGGSDTASEQILAAIRAARAAGKPVVVSMGTYGASGGYWVSSQASAIVAQPTTLTGSIGVFGGKFDVGPALARFGVDMRQLGVGSPYAGAFSPGQSFTPEEDAAFGRWMDRIYDNFLIRVSQGRRLPLQQVQAIARGRVWTGAQARELGLVDQVGGFYEAVARAKALAGLTGEVRLRRMTPQATPFSAIAKLLGVESSQARALAAVGGVLDDPRARPVLDAVAESRLRAQGAMVLAPTLAH